MSKCTETLPPIRVTPEMLDDLKNLAFAADRSPSEYIRHVLRLHVYGNKLTREGVEAEESKAMLCDARKKSRG